MPSGDQNQNFASYLIPDKTGKPPGQIGAVEKTYAINDKLQSPNFIKSKSTGSSGPGTFVSLHFHLAKVLRPVTAVVG